MNSYLSILRLRIKFKTMIIIVIIYYYFIINVALVSVYDIDFVPRLIAYEKSYKNIFI